MGDDENSARVARVVHGRVKAGESFADVVKEIPVLDAASFYREYARICGEEMRAALGLVKSFAEGFKEGMEE